MRLEHGVAVRIMVVALWLSMTVIRHRAGGSAVEWKSRDRSGMSERQRGLGLRRCGADSNNAGGGIWDEYGAGSTMEKLD
jgi:hypothetical protein